jgi:hypothetical protein
MKEKFLFHGQSSKSGEQPRAEELCSNQDLKIGEIVLVNYNMEDSKERGLW